MCRLSLNYEYSIVIVLKFNLLFTEKMNNLGLITDKKTLLIKEP